MNSLPFLSEQEINELTKPLRQRHAQAKRLCKMLGLNSLPRRPDGLPIVGRNMLENRLNGTANSAASSAIAWTK